MYLNGQCTGAEQTASIREEALRKNSREEDQIREKNQKQRKIFKMMGVFCNRGISLAKALRAVLARPDFSLSIMTGTITKDGSWSLPQEKRSRFMLLHEKKERKKRK